MSVRFYNLSGSPFAWKVWLALEHKHISYDLRTMSADRGELKTEEYLAVNPRGKAPAIVHDGFALYESCAIVEYLEEAFADQGNALWPADLRLRALGRRISSEADAYLYPPIRRLVEQLLLVDEGQLDEAIVADSRKKVAENLQLLNKAIMGPFVLGDHPSAADYAAYPWTALLMRLDRRRPAHKLAQILPANVFNWQQEVESLVFFDKTWPVHWGPRKPPTGTESARLTDGY